MPRKMLLQLIILSMIISPTLSSEGSRCKCFMCVCDLDPHPKPPPVVTHGPLPLPPPPKFFYNSPPTETEPVYTPLPPAEFPWEEAHHVPPQPLEEPEIVDGPGEVYPLDDAYKPSSARRRSSVLGSGLVACLLVSGAVVAFSPVSLVLG